MKHFGIKRVVLGVVAACLLVSGGVCASKTGKQKNSRKYCQKGEL